MAIRYPESGPAVCTVKHKPEPTAGTGTATTTEPQARGTHKALPAREVHKLPMFSSALIKPVIVDSFRKLSPHMQAKNPMMFTVYVGSALTTIPRVMVLCGQAEASTGLILVMSVRLWFTVLFANFAEALAKSRSKQQAASLRDIKTTVQAKVSADAGRRDRAEARAAATLRRGDIVLIEVGDMVPGDGEVIEGVVSVDGSAITGESAPVIHESGEGFLSVIGGTRMFLDWITMRITINPGESFLDQIISMVESAKHQKTPDELALTILLASLTIILMLVVVTLLPYSIFSVEAMKVDSPTAITMLVALLVCLIPTIIGRLPFTVGVTSMSHMMQANMIATSGRAIEAAGDVGVLLLDKIGAITHGNHQASRFILAPGVTAKQLAEAAWLSSLADGTPKSHNIVALTCNLGEVSIDEAALVGMQPVYVALSAQTRMSGINVGHSGEAYQIRKGAADAIRMHMMLLAGKFPDTVSTTVDDVMRQGGTPLAASDNDRVLGVVELKDIMKAGIRERFAELRQMGTKTAMITGDNRLTAASVVAGAGVDDSTTEATPGAKLVPIYEQQAQGRLVAMTGGGTSDAPALAQTDMAVAMDNGTQAAKEAGNMADLDPSPIKLTQVVEIGKQMLITRSLFTTFPIVNNVAKYFAIIPTVFVTTYPQLAALDVMHLTTSAPAVTSAAIFNAPIVVFLIPLTPKGMEYRALGATTLLRRNLLIYGLGGLLLPLPGIRIIDMFLAAMGQI